MLWVRNKIKPEIAEKQCGFMEGKGTTNAIYTLWTVIERALQVQKKSIPVLHWLPQGICKSATMSAWWDNHTTNTIEDNRKKSTSDEKHGKRQQQYKLMGKSAHLKK